MKTAFERRERELRTVLEGFATSKQAQTVPSQASRLKANTAVDAESQAST